MVRLNRTHYSLLKFFTGKIFQLSHQVEFQRITQIPRSSPTQSANYAKFAHFVNLFYIMFQAPAPSENPGKFQRITQIPRSSPTQSANYAKFAHFVNLFYIMFQASALAENPGKFQRITQIPHDSPTQPANHANSAHFAL